MLSRLISQCIQLDKVSPKDGEGDWSWVEKDDNTQKEKLKLALAKQDGYVDSVAFSLDKNKTNIRARFPFLREDKEHLERIAAICDIIVLEHKSDVLRAFVIEVKGKKRKNANDQITNGVFFCKWLHCLLKTYYDTPEQLEVVKVLCFTRRQQTSANRIKRKSRETPCNQDTKTLRYYSEGLINLDNAYWRYVKRFGKNAPKQ